MPPTEILIGYARVSTVDQNPQLQLDALEKAGCARVGSDVQLANHGLASCEGPDVLRPIVGSLMIAAITLGVSFEGDAGINAAVIAAYVVCSLTYGIFAWAEHRSAVQTGEATVLELPIEVAAVVFVLAPLMIAAIYACSSRPSNRRSPVAGGPTPVVCNRDSSGPCPWTLPSPRFPESLRPVRGPKQRRTKP